MSYIINFILVWMLVLSGSFQVLAAHAPVAQDLDQDGYDTTTDCDDNQASIHPGAIEVCNGRDDNCDGVIDEGVQQLYYFDEDFDGYGNTNVTGMFCAGMEPVHYVTRAQDCN